MNFSKHSIPYGQTGYFSKIVIDYIEGSKTLKNFYEYEANLDGIKKAIEQRNLFANNRTKLVKGLEEQYKGLQLSNKQQVNIQLLLQQNTFTVTTAHQPNIFTGPLYFIYKIIHAIKLADDLQKQLPEYSFVPFYFMGSEDADLEELGHIFWAGEKLNWQTKQTGAVGRMLVDENLLQLINKMEGTIGVLPFGKELIEIFTKCYTINKTIQQATLELVSKLFAEFGLLILQPDNKLYKETLTEILLREVEFKFSNNIIQFTVNELNSFNYKVQTVGREVNLFYLCENKREKIEFYNNKFYIKKLGKQFNLIEIQEEIKKYPERFSPNVILRPIFQELLLPNIAFIGGGGEIAYWLELKKVFSEAKVHFPVLLLRNSYLMVNAKTQKQIKSLGISHQDLFKETEVLIDEFLTKILSFQHKIFITKEIEDILQLYNIITSKLVKLDPTLAEHSSALKTKAVNKLQVLQKKINRAERNEHKHTLLKIEKLKNQLFPQKNLQERIENFSTYYSKYGNDFFTMLYKTSESIIPSFTIIEE